MNVVLLPALLLGPFEMPVSPANLTGLALVVVLLVEGSAYWATKVLQVRGRLPSPPGLEAFATLGRVNLAMVAAGLVVIAREVVAAPGVASWPGVGLWAFAVGEHVNYFHTQLMPTPAWSGWRPRPSRLRRDLEAIGGR